MARRSTRGRPHADVTDAADATEETALPALSAIRPRAHDPESDDPMVEVRFENGARLRYRAAEDGIREEWIGPAADGPSRSHVVTAPVEHDAEGEADVSVGARPPTRILADRALCSVSTYLSFDDRTQAEFVWGEDNIAALLGE